MAKTGVLLINLGTPDSPSNKDVRKYLTEFLNDPRVIDIPWFKRKLLVNLLIVPFRTANSSRIYKKLWTKEGSPLLLYGKSLQKKLQSAMGDDFGLHLAMRYQNPSIESVLEEMQKCNYEKIIILPLFPQYASSSTGSALEKTLLLINKWWVIPTIQVISQFWDEPAYIDSFVRRAQQFNLQDYDHILFSYHGLPERQVRKVHLDGKDCEAHNCKNEINEQNKFCYRASSYASTRLLAKKLNIAEENYSICFQSRLNNQWLTPFSDEIIEQKAKEGIKKLLVFSPAFVADCLETTVEIGIEYKELFLKKGGERLDLVESLNDHADWVEGLKGIILKST